ncbi:MAG: hypothetical protein PHC61_04870 [Chitinivibrionales bacterium]|nr:hypothetical protein [Chitinivibrionales bacterium]
MRLKTIVSSFVLIIGICAIAVMAQDKEKYVQPTKDGVGIFKNEIRELYETPLFNVGTNDRLLVIESKSKAYKIKLGDKTGWVEKRLVASSGKNKTFVMSDQEVIGYLDNPTPVYIMEGMGPNEDPIKLERSFSDALKENVDKETVERQAK